MSASCQACQGSGVVSMPGTRPMACPACDGTGQQIDPGQFFMYVGDVTLTALQNLPGAITIQILDHSFKWVFAVATSTGTFQSTVKYGQQKRPFMNSPVNNANFWGTAQNPFPLLTPFVFSKRGTIIVDLVDTSNAGNKIELAFIGVELND